MAPRHEGGPAVFAGEAPRSDASSEQRAINLVRTASHDLRSPLTAIYLLVQRIERRRRAGEELTAPEWMATLSRIARSANHALTLVEDMLSAERLSPSNPAIVSPASTVDVEDVIAEAIVLQQEALDEAKCAVTVTRKAGLERAEGAWNRGCLLRIFSNLLQNATKYAPDAPVRVQLARAGDRLRIVFADRGPGLSIRGGDTAGKYLDDGLAPTGPHGLGLWIVRRGVAELNGSIKIRNAPGVGLAFAIELPGLRC
jgi:two-component system, OmpR family, sensor histidine kinase KdpD